MKFMPKYELRVVLALTVAALLVACQLGGPDKALNSMANALRQNDSAAFMAHIDLKALASNEIRNMTRNNEALGALDSIGKMLGLGNVGDLVDMVVDVPARLEKQLSYGVSTGELMAQCRQSTTPGCPWVPDSLRQASAKEVGTDAAVARVTTPSGITTWLALCKTGENWQVVGMAPLESEARAYALVASGADGQRRTTPPATQEQPGQQAPRNDGQVQKPDGAAPVQI